MCQIMYSKYIGESSFSELIDDLTHPISKNAIKNTLNIKGGDGYSIFVASENINPVSFEHEDFDEVLKIFKEYISALFEKDIVSEHDTIHIIYFSRLKPEMENEKVQMPPYQNIIKPNEFIWMHGTIYNDKEIAERFNTTFDVDTKALFYRDIDGVKIKGLYTYFVYDSKSNKVYFKNNGMGLWISDKICSVPTYICTDRFATPGNLEKACSVYQNPKQSDVIELYVSYSGGMDITLSLYDTIRKFVRFEFDGIVNVNLVYFDYGTNASKKEIEALENMSNFIQNNFKNVFPRTVVLNVKDIINSFAKIGNMNIKIADKNATGDVKETEENISYVPYRNSIFIELLGTLIDKDEIENGYVLLGLNLSEGMTHPDNNSFWAEGAERIIQAGGKRYKNIKVLAPYINKTKTEMLKDFIRKYEENIFNKLMEISFSCYYPKADGTACGECGSCILRKKALENVQKI